MHFRLYYLAGSLVCIAPQEGDASKVENFQDPVSHELALTNPYISHMHSMGSFQHGYVNINPNQVFHLNEPATSMLQKRFNSLSLFWFDLQS